MRLFVQLSSIILITAFVMALKVWPNMSPFEHLSEELELQAQCISKEEIEYIKAHSLKLKDRGIGITPLLMDPVGNGGINSFGKPFTAGFDHDATVGILDYKCGTVTYDSHYGTDIAIRDFYDMDEGIPILAAAAGVVVFTDDGHYDRIITLIPGTPANGCVVEHADGSQALYLHMKTYSLRVQAGDTVEVGDTLGMIGSSGYSNGPHLHFGIAVDTTVDPFNGPCQAEASLWAIQPAYTMDLPFAAVMTGVTGLQFTRELSLERPPSITHLEATGSDTLYVWVRYTSRQLNDTLTWRLYENGNLWFEISHTPSSPTKYAYMYLKKPMAGLFGDWVAEIMHNGSVVFHHEFVYDVVPNQPPVIAEETFLVDVNGSLDGTFVADDPDGSVFWYETASNPTNGSLKQSGGRKRKFSYTPDPGFLGLDSVTVYAIDDDSLVGPEATYVFDVSGNCCIGTRGDVNGDGNDLDIIDLTTVADFLFGVTPMIPCPNESDVNGDGSGLPDIVDLTFVVDWLFGIAPTLVACP